MKIQNKHKRNGEYSEYEKIVKIVNNARKKALLFNKTDFQKKLEKAYRFC